MDSEVTVVGAGVIGSSLACLLSNQGIKVTLIDRGNPLVKHNNSSKESARTVALNLSSIDLLKKIDIWSDLEKAATPFERIYVWDSKGSSPLQFLAQDIHKEELGCVITNDLILESLKKPLKKSKRLNLQADTELSKIKINEKGVVITCTNGKKFHSKLLVGADGVTSTLRSLSGIKTRTWSYNQKAFVAGLKTDKSHLQTAWQIFTPKGPIALLPCDCIEGVNVSLIWSAENDYANKLSSLTKKEFIKELETKTELILGKIDLKTEVNSFPLNQLHAKSYFSERIVLVGDAAHALHPLAGQGMNLGLSDVASLNSKVVKARRAGLDIGSNSVLKRYERSRKIPNLTMTTLMELFKKGFESSDPWARLFRNLAFQNVSRNKILKRKFIKEAAGIT